jgi:arylformamidase
MSMSPDKEMQGPEAIKQTPVWLDMDQKALDDAYDQLVYAPNREQVNQRNRFNSDRARKRLGVPKRMSYGSQPVEQLDLFATARPNAPIHIFIHGGAWRARPVKDYAFMAEMFVRAGAHWVGLDFDGVEGTAGALLPMADQVRRAVAWVYKNAASFGGDPNRIYLSGQSSGAHLGGCVVTTDWKEYGMPDDVVKGGLLCSGMYDLKPVRLSKRSQYVTFTEETEEQLSPQRHLHKVNCPLIIAYGTYETPEFQRQSREFAAALNECGKPVNLLVGEGYNHFEMTEMIGNPISLVGRAVLEQMRLA